MADRIRITIDVSDITKGDVGKFHNIVHDLTMNYFATKDVKTSTDYIVPMKAVDPDIERLLAEEDEIERRVREQRYPRENF